MCPPLKSHPVLFVPMVNGQMELRRYPGLSVNAWREMWQSWILSHLRTLTFHQSLPLRQLRGSRKQGFKVCRITTHAQLRSNCHRDCRPAQLVCPVLSLSSWEKINYCVWRSTGDIIPVSAFVNDGAAVQPCSLSRHLRRWFCWPRRLIWEIFNFAGEVIL